MAVVSDIHWGLRTYPLQVRGDCHILGAGKEGIEIASKWLGKVRGPPPNVDVFFHIEYFIQSVYTS